jgi:3-methyladenine DNA glycosylase AlkD
MTAEQIIKELRSLSNKRNREGMSRFGINTDNAFGVSIPALRNLAKRIGKDHNLSLKLWASGYHEARILASMIDKPALVTGNQMERWAGDFNSWDLCDQCCSNLFDKTPYAYTKAFQWSSRNGEFVKRAGFTMMATLAVHDKKAEDDKFLEFLPVIKRESGDERNFVRKAVNWALRQIGKRNKELNKAAIKTAVDISKSESKTAKWIASDAIRELKSSSVQVKLKSMQK